MRWDRADGHLLLVGSAGTGVTSALALLGVAVLTDGSSSHLYVIDGRGGQALQLLSRAPACAGVVRVHERERLIRMINRLAGELNRRIADPSSPRQPIVVLIDGFDAVRSSLDEFDTSAELEMLDSILLRGLRPRHRHGLRIRPRGRDLIQRPGPVPSTLDLSSHRPVRGHWSWRRRSRCSWAVARPPRRCLHSVAGAADGWFAAAALRRRCHGPRPVECLPSEIDAADLPPGHGRGDDSLLPVGIRFDDGGVCTIDVPDGEHLLIVGTARSGRSTVLRRIVRAWREAYPHGWCRIVAPRRASSGGEPSIAPSQRSSMTYPMTAAC